MKKFNSFALSAVEAIGQSDKDSNCSVVAEKMKLVADSSSGYHIMDRSRTVTKYLSDEKTHAAINSKFFRKLDHGNKALYEIGLAKAHIEHKEPFILGFSIVDMQN